MRLPHRVVVGDQARHFRRIVEQGQHVVHRLRRHFLTNLHCADARRLDVRAVRGVRIDDQRLAEVERLDQRVAEALIRTEIGHEVGVRVDVPQRVGAPPVLHAAPLHDAVADEQGANARRLHLAQQPVVVRAGLIACVAGDDQDVTVPGVVRAQLAHQLDRPLDVLAAHDARRLEDQPFVRGDAQFVAHSQRVVVRRRGQVAEVEDIGNIGCAQAAAHE